MQATYRIIFAPTTLSADGPVCQFQVPAAGVWKLAGIRLTQDARISSAVVRLGLCRMGTLATGGTDATIRGTSTPAPTATAAPFSDPGTIALTEEYYGWNVVSGEYVNTPPPDVRVPLTAGASYSLQLLSDPPSGGLPLAGQIHLVAEL